MEIIFKGNVSDIRYYKHVSKIQHISQEKYIVSVLQFRIKIKNYTDKCMHTIFFNCYLEI